MLLIKSDLILYHRALCLRVHDPTFWQLSHISGSEAVFYHGMSDFVDSTMIISVYLTDKPRLYLFPCPMTTPAVLGISPSPVANNIVTLPLCPS